jgi:hypothetical protein
VPEEEPAGKVGEADTEREGLEEAQPVCETEGPVDTVDEGVVLRDTDNVTDREELGAVDGVKATLWLPAGEGEALELAQAEGLLPGEEDSEKLEKGELEPLKLKTLGEEEGELEPLRLKTLGEEEGELEPLRLKMLGEEEGEGGAV